VSETQEAREVKAAQNQLVFRHVNERIRELGDRVLDSVFELDFTCECDDPACTKTIEMPIREFVEMDEITNRFIVLPGHEDNAVEEAVATSDRSLIVAKRGAGAEYVEEHSEGASEASE
jgi:hypothetical protein